jgi:ATP-dependent Lon protease
MNNDNELISLPVIPLKGITVFPKMNLNFDFKNRKSIEALEFSMANSQKVFLVTQKETQAEEQNSVDEIYEFGTITNIKQLIKLPGNIVRVVAEGETRGRLNSMMNETAYLMGMVEVMKDEPYEITDNQSEALLRTGKEAILEFVNVNTSFSLDITNDLLQIKELTALGDAIGANLIYSIENKQRLLSRLNPIHRLKLALAMLNTEIEILSLKKKINTEVKRKIDKNQRDYYLREQIKIIQEELGEGNNIEEESDEYLKKLETIKPPQQVAERLKKEILRLKKMPAGSSEGVVKRNYIELLLDLPWNQSTVEPEKINMAQKILDEDHYGLEKVKERILEHLAVRKVSNNTDSPIICLVGPPGTGKTSIAKSIARALNRKYTRISLGGIRDEADIRGHRKTYIGAMPGRIVDALKNAGSNNPLILLDEIDKMTSDFRGDPASALLEVLDSEQNKRFRDHFVEVEMDLSKVLFVATANSLKNLSRPLLDRLEVIEISSYTVNEKQHIAQEYLIQKQIAKHGLVKGQLTISKKAVEKIINEYTREAGVRSLERNIGDICRKVVKEILMNDKEKISITNKNIKNYLGVPRFSYEQAADEPQIGIARGLAWTEVGGETLSIEVNVMEGTGKFELTGQLGEVMKESAMAAISYIRSKPHLVSSIDIDFYKKKDIHIHIPQGAVPKDGPSAGITMATAMVSALSRVPVDNTVAMTGEITLRGRILPIGGLKEKLIAAKRAQIETVLVPEKNRKNIEEVSQEIKENINIIFVNNMDEVLKLALIDKKATVNKKGGSL